MREYLGFPVRDRVIGFTGVITSLSFDLFGCVQCGVTPKLVVDDKTGEQKIGDSRWFDANRLERLSDEKVLPVPEFPFVTPMLAGAPAPQKQRRDYTGPADKAPPR